MSIADKLTTIANNAQKVNESNAELEYTLDARILGRTLQENVNLLNTDKSNIVNAFKSKGANVVNDMPLGVLADEVETVYNKGYSQAESDFWDGFQNYGNRKSYYKGFQYWGAEYIKPKYKVAPTGQASYLFADNANLKGIYTENFDLGNVAAADAWNGGIYGLCQNCTSLEYFGDINMQPNTTVGYMFYRCYKLKKIEILRVDEKTLFNGTFHGCPELEEVWIDGVIASRGNDNNALSFPSSTKLKKECVLDIFEHLKDFSETELTARIGLPREIIAKLTEEEKDIARNKGWSIFVAN